MTPERLRLIRVVHEKFCEWCEQQMECPVSDLLAEVDRLRRWKAEATPVIMGLQDLGRALELPLGENITGPAALAAVDRLRAKVTELEEENEWFKNDH